MLLVRLLTFTNNWFDFLLWIRFNWLLLANFVSWLLKLYNLYLFIQDFMLFLYYCGDRVSHDLDSFLSQWQKDLGHEIDLLLFYFLWIELYYEVFLFHKLRSRSIFEVRVNGSRQRLSPLKFGWSIWAGVLEFDGVYVRSGVWWSYKLTRQFLVRLRTWCTRFLGPISTLVWFDDFRGSCCVVERGRWF